MDGPRDDQIKQSKSEKERQLPYDFTDMWNLKCDTKCTYLQSRNRLTDAENRAVVVKGEGAGGGVSWEFGISICKLLYTEWINNEVLLYSTGNYVHYPVMNRNGEEHA